ncbi:MAG TPA: MgtC/SapB family protein [Vicinamibacterales bacterium]|nr:MgtC/SapB family protein [Vicinamibacterales bacterium]
MRRLLLPLAVVALSFAPVFARAPVFAQPFPGAEAQAGGTVQEHPAHPMHELDSAFVALPLATVLGAALALRPRRRGTPARTPAVIQTQIILALVGAVIMLIVGASVARAFAIVGAASLIRYRSKIDDPKDAGVMLCALAIGLAAGVGLYALATFSTGFMLLVVWIIESFEPKTKKTFELHVRTKDSSALRPALESLLRRQQTRYELRTSSQDELSYVVDIPYDRRTDQISNAILQLDPSNETSVDWDEKTKKGK